MRKSHGRRWHIFIWGVVAVFALTLAAWQGSLVTSITARFYDPKLTSIVPLFQEGGDVCPFPASEFAPASLALVSQTSGPVGSTLSSNGSKSVASSSVDRPPLRVIHDDYPTYSAIAVDTNSNEVYLQDENLFGYKVFNRMDNTPPNALMTEPKRVVAGLDTRLEFNCGLYVDPQTGDVYSVNNDTIDLMVVFPRDAKGNQLPKRKLETPHGTYGIAVDEQAEELFLTSEHYNSVSVYRKFAEGDAAPIRTLQGDRTQLEDPHGIALDTKNGLMFVSNHGHSRNRTIRGSGTFEPPSITVYPLKATGNTQPIRIIEGTKTQLNWPAHMYIDAEKGELYVANDVEDSILVFRTTDAGDSSPTRVIRGPKTGIKNPTGIFVDTKNQEVWVANMGNHSATVYPLSANGDVAPLRTIRSAPVGKKALAIGNPGSVGYDTKRDEILVPN